MGRCTRVPSGKIHLGRGRCAGGSAGEEQLGMEETDLARRIRALYQRSRKIAGCQRSRNPDVCSLANLAGAVALPFRMDVTGRNYDKENREKAKPESQKRFRVLPASRVALPLLQDLLTPARLDAGARRAVSTPRPAHASLRRNRLRSKVIWRRNCPQRNFIGVLWSRRGRASDAWDTAAQPTTRRLLAPRRAPVVRSGSRAPRSWRAESRNAFH